MKKNLIAIAALSILIVSCGPSKEDYDNAAKELCDCSSNIEDYKDLIGLPAEIGGMTEQSAKETQYGVCIKKVEDNEGVDFKSDEMMASIKDKCPDLESVHKEYVESSKGGDDEEK